MIPGAFIFFLNQRLACASIMAACADSAHGITAAMLLSMLYLPVAARKASIIQSCRKAGH